MKTNTQLFIELLNSSIEEPLKNGDIMLTWGIKDEPMLMIEQKNSPICMAVGWDITEKNIVFSLN